MPRAASAARVWSVAVEREPSPERADELRVRLALLRLRHQGYPEALHLLGRVALKVGKVEDSFQDDTFRA